MAHAIIDLDYVKYTCAAVGEKRTIVVTHKASGNTKEFANRTAFYGRDKKSGWLGERNASRTSPFSIDEFEIEDVQTPEPVENALYTAKNTIERAIALSGCKSYVGYLGQGDSFRREQSTILEYKGNRKELIKPIHLDALTEYLIGRWKAKVVTGLEADDWCVIDCHDTDNILVGVDKDYFGCNVHYLNMNENKIINCKTFGQLRLNDKKKVKGFGRQFFYFQVASGDSIDNYKANSGCETKWGEKSAYDMLAGATNDGEAIQALVNVYKTLYPKPTEVEGWRKNIITVDWMYMLTENWNMARMFTSPNDKFYDQQDMLNLFEMYGVKS
jgi:hypothetical protein